MFHFVSYFDISVANFSNIYILRTFKSVSRHDLDITLSVTRMSKTQPDVPLRPSRRDTMLPAVLSKEQKKQ